MTSNRYRCLNRQEYHLNGYKIQPLREEDILLIMRWRNQQMDVLRQKKPLNDNDQRRYYKEVILPTFNTPYPEQIIFSFLHNNKCIGYGGLVHIDWQSRRGEMSFLVDTEHTKQPETYRKDFIAFIALIKDMACNDLKLQRLFTETYDCRPLHIAVLEESGFIREGVMRRHVMINDELIDSLIHGYLTET